MKKIFVIWKSFCKFLTLKMHQHQSLLIPGFGLFNTEKKCTEKVDHATEDNDHEVFI